MSFYKNIGGLAQPRTKDELQYEINIRLNRGQTNLNDIDTSKITDMSNLFNNLDRNIDVSLWDVSNVTDMRCMFYECSYFNSDLSRWDVSKVREMAGMFCDCTDFNSDLSKWDVSNVTNMNNMFYSCYHFNCNLSGWDVSKVENMSNMFDSCTRFNCDLSKWDVRNVRDMGYMFFGCSDFDCDLSDWNTKSVLFSVGMFINSGIKEKPSWYKVRGTRRCYTIKHSTKMQVD